MHINPIEMIGVHEVIAGARFEVQINDPSHIGRLTWIGCEVLSETPMPTVDGPELWRVRRDDGTDGRYQIHEFRRVRS